MNLTASVLHNISIDTFFRHEPETSKLFHAHDFQITADNVETAASLVWDLANVDDANHLQSMRPDLGHYGPQVTHYRARRNRSLSVGDVIVFHEGDRYAGTAVVLNLGFGWTNPVTWEAGENTTRFSESYVEYQLQRWGARQS